MSTRVWESSLINAPIHAVWTIVRRLDWGWSPKVQAVRTVPADTKEQAVQPPLSGAMGVGDERTILYRDDTKQRIRLMALSDQDHSLSWSVVDSTPALTYSGVSHTISLRRVTTTAAGTGESTYIEWDVDFAKDAANDVLADQRLKVHENFNFLKAEAARGDLNYLTGADEAARICMAAAKLKDLSAQTILITGANTGLGLETARVLIANGARVIGTVRDEKKAESTKAALVKLVPNAKHTPEMMVCSLESFASINAFVEAYTKKIGALTTLILNAGVMACPQSFTEEKFELQIGVNHFGHFLLTRGLTPLLAKSAPGRVVVLSSAGHNISDVNLSDINWSKAGSYDNWKAYGASKSANILFAKQLNQRFVDQKVPVTVNALHPGVIIDTDLGRHVRGGPLPPYRFKTISSGSSTTIVAALHPKYGPGTSGSAGAGVGGVYLVDCNEVATGKHITNEQAKKLWDLTEQMIAAASKK